MNKVSLIIITDGRQACISETIPSMRKNLNYNFYEKIIINDSADLRYHQYLMSNYPDFRIVSHETIEVWLEQYSQHGLPFLVIQIMFFI